MVAVLEKKLSSEVGFRGIFKKVLIFAFVGIGNIIDVYILKNGSAIRTAVIFFYISNEGISIIENAAKIGLPIPQKLKDILEQLNEEE
jgi:toxin secretion/phage lysis holin